MMERALRIATWTAAAMLLAGLALWIAGVAPAVLALHAGLWLLIATPITRVVMALAGFLQARDWTFFTLTAVVLACLVVPILTYFLSSPR